MASADVVNSSSGVTLAPGESHPGASGSSLSATSGAAANPNIDERLIARAALESAEDRLRSLCAAHAATFVAVERRGAALEAALSDLRMRVEEALPMVEVAGRALGSEDEGDRGGDGTGGGGGGSSRTSASAALAALAERHRLRRRTLLQHSSLLELLELPSLMDACVRSELYDEALGIAGFANTLERRHLLDSDHAHVHRDGGGGADSAASDAPHQKNDVVASVVAEIRRREADLRHHLLHRLRSDVTMPQCLEAVTALRRLNGVEIERMGHRAAAAASFLSGGGASQGAFDAERVHASMELRLMVDFLEARDAWLDSGAARAAPPRILLAAASAAAVAAGGDTGGIGASAGSLSSGRASGVDGRSEQILDGIERYRTRTFEIATQFLAIFRADTSVQSNLSMSSREDPSLSLLSMWTTRRIQLFLARLRRDLSSGGGLVASTGGEGGRRAAAAGARQVVSASSSSSSSIEYDISALRDALDAASFFAASMGRVGADFRPLLLPVFEPRVAAAVKRRWTDGVAGLKETLRVCRDAGVASPLFGTAASSPEGCGGGIGAGMDGGFAAGAAAERYRTEGVSVTATTTATTTTSVTAPPPRRLLSLPPLARLVNAHLSGLNELRRCLLPGTFPTLRRALDVIVAEVRGILAANERAVLAPGLRGEAARLREAAKKMKEEFVVTVEPYMKRSLEVAFGNLDLQNEEEERKKKELEEKANEESVPDAEGGDLGGNGSVDASGVGAADVTTVADVGHVRDEAELKREATEKESKLEPTTTKNADSTDGANEDDSGGDGGGEGWDDDELDDGLYD